MNIQPDINIELPTCEGDGIFSSKKSENSFKRLLPK